MQKKQKKEGKKKAQKKGNTHFLGGPWKWAASSSTIFLQKIGFFKILKNPSFIVFPEKMRGNHFFPKRLC